MKKILLILFVLISFVSSAQKLQFDNTYGREFQRVQVDTLLGLPKDTFLVPATLQNIPFIANKSGSIYLWNISTFVWDLFSSGGSYTDADARAAISLTTTGIDGLSTYNPVTGVINNPNYTTTSSQGITKTGSDFKLGGYMPANSTFHIPSALILNSPVSRIIMENRSLDSSFYGVAGISNIQGNTFAQPALRSARLYKEEYNDTLQLQYGGNLYTITRTVFDSVSTRFAAGNKIISIPIQGVYGGGQIYFPRDSVVWNAGRDGNNATVFQGDLDLGDSYGYNVNIVSGVPNLPISVYRSNIDFIRVVDQARRKKMNGPITNYLSALKIHQSPISSGTFEVGNHWSKATEFTAFGLTHPDIGSSVSKSKILAVARMDTAIGFLSNQKYSPFNEVVNAYGFIALGDSDRNYFQGPTRIGGTIPGHTTEPSAILDVVSTGRGVVWPRMTTVQKDAISSPATGLIVFDTDLVQYNFWDGDSWEAMGGGGATPTLQQVFNTEVGGSIMSKSDSIMFSGSDQLRIIQSGTTNSLWLNNTGTGGGAFISTVTGIPVNATMNVSATNTRQVTGSFGATTSGSVADGFGAGHVFTSEYVGGLTTTIGENNWQWMNATDRTSKYTLLGDSVGVLTKFLELQHSGISIVNNGADTLATRAYARSVGGGGGITGSITKNWFDDDLTLDGVTTKINRADIFDDMLTTPNNVTGTSYMFEFVSGTGADASIGNTGTTVPDGSGWAAMSTGTTTAGISSLSSTSPSLVKNKVDTTKAYRFETRLQIETLSDDTEDFRINAGFCLYNTNVTGPNFIYFRYNDNTNGGNWTCYSSDGSTTESTNSAVAAAAGAAVILGFEYDNAQVRFYINGSLVATHTTNIPVHDANTNFPVMAVTKTAGTTNRNVFVDYVKYRRL